MLPQASGRVHSQGKQMLAAAIGASIHGHGEKTALSTIPAAKATAAITLPRLLIAPRVRHATICGPIRGCPTSHASSRGEERAKQKAAKITSGTVGNSGSNMPMPASNSETQPPIR